MFDAGAVAASLTVDTSKFDSDLAKAEARVKKFESDKHEVKLSAVFDTSSLSRARQQFAQLDQQVSKDAMSRLRSSPQGSVLGALNALFSPHPVTGAPSASQAAQQGLLGKIISAPGGGGTAGPVSSNAQSNVVSRVLGTSTPSSGTISTTDRVNTVGLPTDNAISTTDRVNVTGLPTTGGTVTTTDKVKPQLDEAGLKDDATKAGKDAADAADDSMTKEAKARGSNWFSGFLTGIPSMTSGAGGNGKSGKNGSGGSSSGALDSGLVGGIGPGILGISTKVTAIGAGVATALAALPALAGVAGTGMGVALIGGLIAGAVKTSPGLQKEFTSIGIQAKTAITQATAPLVPAIQAVLQQVPGLLKAIEPQLAGISKVVAPQIQGVFAGLTPIIQGLIGVMQAAAPAFGPFIEGLEKLAANVFPGIEAVVKATVPVIGQFASILGQLGSNLGGLFASAAPAIGASMQVLGDLLSVVGGLLPILTKLGSIFATALAPIFTQFGAVVKSLEPVLILVGQVLASLAQAVVGDLVSAFGALATAIHAATPGLTALAKGLGTVFTTMENAGVFAVLGDALENLAAPLGTLVSTLAAGLVPVLTSVVQFVAQLSAVIVAQLTSAVLQLLPSLTKLATVALAGLAEVLPVILPLLVQVAGVLTGALAATIAGVASALASVIAAIPPPVLGAIVVGVTAVVAGMKLWAATMALIEGSAFAGAVTGIIDVVTAFAEATAGLTVAETGLTAASLALDAVNPFVWVGLALAPLAALSVALVAVSAQSQTIVGEFAQQQQSLNYNISAYKQLAATVETASQGYAKFAQANSDAVRGGAGAVTLANQLHQQAQGISASTVTILGKVADLSQGLGVSKTVIEQWATAAGITAPKLATVGENVGLATQQLIAFVNKNAEAVTATSSLGTNITIFGDDVFNATAQLDAFNQIWNTLVGSLLTKQQAVTQSQQSFDNLKQSIADNGKASTQTQASFQAYIQQIQTSLDSLQKGGASVSDLNGYLQTQIDHLGTLGPLNKGEQQDLANLKAVQDILANSTNGLNAQQKTLISQFETGLIPSLQQMNVDTPKVTGDISNLTNSIIQTGAKSAATAGDRAKLIADLKQAGLTSQQAAQFVDGLQGKIDALKGKVVAVDVHGTGSGHITATENILGEKSQTLGNLTFVARGGMITGGTPGKDSVLGMLMPGEVVVPAGMVASGAVDHLRGMLPGFAAGGLLAGSGQDYEGASGSTFLHGAANAGTGPLLNAFLTAAGAAAAKAITVAQQGNPQAGPGGGSPAANYALAQALYPAYKGTSVMDAWNYVAMAESGWNQFARNPSSGAYGIPQALPESKLPFAGQAAGGSNPSAQIQWMWDYMASTYGGPIGAAQHEAAYHWYGNGGAINEPVLGWGMHSGDRYVLGERGSEMVTPVGGMRGGGTSMDDLADLLKELNGHMRQQIRATQQVPAGVGQHVGGALSGAAHDASFRSRYPRSN